MNGIVLSGLYLFLIGCPNSRQQSPIADPDISAPQVQTTHQIDPERERHFSISSSITGIEYPLHIYLPRDYAESDKNYPVVYATDGQWIFSGFSHIIDRKNKDLILVAIEQGPNNRRATDYRLPGVHNYFAFLTAELLPLIETDFRVDPTNRTLIGTSYGGILAGLAPLIDDIENPLFKHYLSFDPSFYEHQNATLSLEQERFNASNRLGITLFLSSATLRGNDAFVTWYQDILEQRQYSGLRIIRRSYAVDHNDVANPSFETALDLLF